jgi:osmotically-inducible protein OsmY
VGSFQEGQAAVRVAKSVRGVRDVEDQLMACDDAPADRVDVKVDAGWLTLKGEVKHQVDIDAGFAAVSGVPGVGGITNEIKVITASIDG